LAYTFLLLCPSPSLRHPLNPSTSQVVFVDDCIGEPVTKALAGMANGDVSCGGVVHWIITDS